MKLGDRVMAAVDHGHIDSLILGTVLDSDGSMVAVQWDEMREYWPGSKAGIETLEEMSTLRIVQERTK